MKTFRIIGMALFAVLMCVNLASCSSSDDDPTEEPEEGGVVVSGKRITKIVGMSKNGDSEICTFKYDNKGRLIEGKRERNHGTSRDNYQKAYTWGDNAIKTSDDSGHNYTFILKNGLVQGGLSKNYTFTYSKSNRIIQIEDLGEYKTILWDGNKLVSITDEDEWDATLTYEKSCKKGYFPFIATMIEVMYEDLFIANPEIAGMLTTQLPASMAITYVPKISTTPHKETFNFTYEFDKEGYISKIINKGSDGSLWTYTLTWK